MKEDHFSLLRLADLVVAPEVSFLKKSYEAIIGYYGALANWVDYRLIRDVARLRPEWCWCLIGPDYDGSMGKSGILEEPNVFYLGPKPCYELPSYLAGFDIAAILFKLNNITLSTSPIKLFEYMAGGKPIVSTPLPECLKYGSVHIAKTATKWVTTCEVFLKLSKDDPYWQLLEKEAAENSWDARARQIMEALGIKV